MFVSTIRPWQGVLDLILGNSLSETVAFSVYSGFLVLLQI